MRFGLAMTKDLAIYSKIINYIAASRRSKPLAIALGSLAIFAMVTLLFGLFFAAFKKLDHKTEYSVQVKSDVVTYTPNSQGAPKLLLRNFKILTPTESCTNTEPVSLIEEGEIKFLPSAIVQFAIKKKDEITIQVKSKSAKENEKLAVLQSDFYQCSLNKGFVLRVFLTENDSRVLFNLVGSISVGTKLSYATDSYAFLLKEGDIQIIDSSFLAKTPLTFVPDNLKKGDFLEMPSEADVTTMGILSASLNEESFDGMFFKKGGVVTITKPFSEPVELKINLLDRVLKDNILAFFLSISFLFFQILAFLTTTIIRIHFLSSTSNLAKEFRKGLKE